MNYVQIKTIANLPIALGLSGRELSSHLFQPCFREERGFEAENKNPQVRFLNLRITDLAAFKSHQLLLIGLGTALRA